MPPKLYIATPCAHETILSHTAASLFQLATTLAHRNIQATLTTIGSSDIEVTRSILASHFFAEPTYTHLLFVDSDMDVPAPLVLRMLDLGEDFTSAIYVRRELDLPTLIRHARTHPGEPPETILARTMRHIGKPHTPPPTEPKTPFQVTIRNGFMPAEQTGMGLCLLTRRVFAEMVERGLVATDGRPCSASPFPVPYYGFFHRDRPPTGAPASEDFAFCRRWTQDCGGTIWACVDTPVGHVGHFRFAASYLHKLRTGEA